MPDDKPAESAARPEAQRVANRALVLSAVAYRGWLEGHAGSHEPEMSHRGLLQWLRYYGLYDELEVGELDFLRLPLGSAERQEATNACWRAEGVAVLAWA